MSGSPLILVDSLAFTVSIIISVLAAYRAYTSRKVLATPLYRNRALWTGTVAIMLALFDAWGIDLENTSSAVTFGMVPPPGTLEFYAFVALTAAFTAVVFAWIDSTIRVALELDFMHRDALRWKSLRPFAGIALVLGTIIAQFASATPVLLVSVALLVVPAAYVAATLVVGGSRVRVETMRRYMKGMGFLVATLLLQVGTSTISPYLNFPLAITAYFLYRMSTSLLKTAPLSAATLGNPSSEGRAGTPDQGPL